MHTNPQQNIESVPSAALAPAWATLILTWFNNLGAATTLIGIYFITVHKYHFTGAQNLGLGLLQGVTYIAGALSAGPGMRALGKSLGWSTRFILSLTQIAMAACCFLPGTFHGSWTIWLMVGIYSPLSGWLWPTIESYLSAGRSGQTLRRATGMFNIGWASSQVAVFWMLAPFVKDEQRAPWAIAIMGCSHLVCLGVMWAIPREPASGSHNGAHAHSPEERARYVRLLAAFRLAIILCYVLYSTLNPLLPIRAQELHVAAQWATPLASAWMIARVITFAVMQQWHGWHGKRTTLIWSLGALVLGCAVSLVAPAWPVLLVSLAVFGIGLGGIYSAAFYYAMEVGHAGVDAGGKHEAFIGVGYTIGPLAGLAAASIAPAPVTGSASHLPVLISAMVVALVFVSLAARTALRPTRI